MQSPEKWQAPGKLTNKDRKSRPVSYAKPRSLYLGTTDTWGGSFLAMGASYAGFEPHPLPHHPRGKNQKCLQSPPNVPCEAKPLLGWGPLLWAVCETNPTHFNQTLWSQSVRWFGSEPHKTGCLQIAQPVHLHVVDVNNRHLTVQNH